MVEKNEPLTNENTRLRPKTSFDGPVLKLDFPSIEIGTAEYEEGPTGCTVFYFPKGANSVVDIRGGMSVTTESSLLEDGVVSAICFAGGNRWGLEAVTGVSAQIFSTIDYAGGHRVRGAVIYDFGVRDNKIYPDKELGRAAMKSAQSGVFPLGSVGAGRSATVGKFLRKPYQAEPGGQGAAFYQEGPTKIAVFAVVNSLGAIIDRAGKVVRGHLNSDTGKREKASDVLKLNPDSKGQIANISGNTTLTVVAINQKMDLDDLRQLSRQVHSSMARAIDPFHTTFDGDVLYAVTTNEVENSDLKNHVISYLASEVAWDAVLSCCQDQ